MQQGSFGGDAIVCCNLNVEYVWPMTISRKLFVILHAVTATVLSLLSFLAESLFVLCVGILVLFGAFLNTHSRMSALSARLCTVLLPVALVVILFELAFNLIKFDFDRLEPKWQNLPPFARGPTVPIGSVYFCRSGPEEWTGQVIRRTMDGLGVESEAYEQEPSITVRYNIFGFRNEQWPGSWEIAVAGDSFVELGNLAFNDLYTTKLSSRIGRPVLNLGVNYTGPLTHLSYIEAFGISQMTKHVLIVFYEGNDLEDLAREYSALQQYELTGTREQRTFVRQTSMLRALTKSSHSFLTKRMTPSSPRINSYYLKKDGKVPITLTSKLVTNIVSSAETERAFDLFLDRYATFGHAHRVKTWLVFMPSKARVLDGRFEWAHPDESFRVGRIHRDLPLAIAQKCSKHNIEFFDLTSGLVEEQSKTGELLYNHVFDSHLNARGADVVAELLSSILLSATSGKAGGLR